jgi:hypothetical protein
MKSKDEEKKHMSTTRQETLIEITHPLFWSGYQEGRQSALWEQYVLTDKKLLRCLRFPVKRSKRKPAAERERDLYTSIGKLVGEMSACVLPREPYEESSPDLQEKPDPPLRQEPLEITHLMFWYGYQEGRMRYSHGKFVFTDKELVAGIWQAFLPRKFMSDEEEENSRYYEIGQLIGKMSMYALPLQPHEERAQEQQVAFQAKVRVKYKTEGDPHIMLLRQFWILRDQLAQILDTTIFEKLMMSYKDAEDLVSVSET